jgi:surface antigen
MFIRYLRLTLSGVAFACATIACGENAFAQETPLADDDLEHADSYVADPSQSFVFEPSASYEAALSGPSGDERAELYAGESPTPLTQPLPREQQPDDNCQTLRETVDGQGDNRTTEGTLCEKSDGSWQAMTPPAMAEASPAGPEFVPECREFRRRIVIEGRYETVHGTECQDHDGVWRAVNPTVRSPTTIVTAAPEQRFSEPARYCRKIQRTIVIDGYARRAHGTECQRPDGSWQLVDRRFQGPSVTADASFRTQPPYRTYRSYPNFFYDDQDAYGDVGNGRRPHPGRGRNKPHKW